jgi:hypothetical protein
VAESVRSVAARNAGARKNPVNLNIDFSYEFLAWDALRRWRVHDTRRRRREMDFGLIKERRPRRRASPWPLIQKRMALETALRRLPRAERLPRTAGDRTSWVR